ncbi:MAG: hypothetical protein ACP5I3_09640 [Thermoproteus sp.]
MAEINKSIEVRVEDIGKNGFVFMRLIARVAVGGREWTASTSISVMLRNDKVIITMVCTKNGCRKHSNEMSVEEFAGWLQRKGNEMLDRLDRLYVSTFTSLLTLYESLKKKGIDIKFGDQDLNSWPNQPL